MESLPKLPMLIFELKTSVSSPDFEACLKKIIRDFYQEDPNSYNKEIKELESLRNKAMKVPHDVSGCSLLKRYYAQIYTLQNRFKTHNTSFDVEFVWLDAYKGVPVSGNVDFELDCVMYNIGALHGQLGALDLRNRAENMKVSCTHFQCAAWAFEQLRDKPRSSKSRDISHDVISFFHQVMLAQAQECILEKSILDKRKASITAKVAAQVIEYYNSALLVLLQAAVTGEPDSLTEIVTSRLYKEWKKFIEFKITYFSSLCSFYMGNYCEELQKMGERVAWYVGAEQKVNEAAKQSKGLDRPECTDAVKFLTDVVASKIGEAKRENDFVYHQTVPTPDKLTAVKGASLVKGIAFSVTDPEVCGTDIFARLVPMEAHEVASVYSEQKDKLIREVSAKIDDKNQDLASYMSSLQLESMSLRPQPVTVPDELIEICAAISVNQNATVEATQSLKKLEDLCAEVDKSIKEARALISNEEEKEKQHQEKFGKRAPSMIMVELSKELMKHEETHREAMRSHHQLKNELSHCEKDVQLLITCSAKDLENLLPTVSDVGYDEKTLEEIERLVAKVNEMREQRHMLEKQLREMVQKDDVLKKVLALPKNEVKEMFDQELKKYDNHVKLLHQNMEAQDNILSALTKANAKYAETRKALLDQERRRRERIEEIIRSYETFHRILGDIDKGIQFYSKFQNMVGRLLARVRSVSRVQEEERTQFLEIQAKKEKRILQYDISSKQSQWTGAPKLKDYLPYMNQPNKQPQVTPAAAPEPAMLTPVVSSTSVCPSLSLGNVASVSNAPVASSYATYPTHTTPYSTVSQASSLESSYYNHGVSSVETHLANASAQYPSENYGYTYGHQHPTVQNRETSYSHHQPVSQSHENYGQQQPVSQNQETTYGHQQPVPQSHEASYSHQQPVSQNHENYGQMQHTAQIQYGNQYSNVQQPLQYTQPYVQAPYQSYEVPQPSNAISGQNVVSQTMSYPYQDPASQGYTSSQYQIPATAGYAISSGTVYPVEVQHAQPAAHSLTSTSLPSQTQAYVYSHNGAPTSGVPTNVASTNVAYSVVSSQVATLENGVSGLQMNNTVPANASQPTKENVEVKNTPDPNNLLSQFDPLWS